LKNFPNILTIGRILLVPILVTVLFTKVEGKEWYGLGLFLAAALTDFLDGYFARRWHQITRLGMILDPAADKILMASAFISLVELNPAVTPAWMVALILAREFAVGITLFSGIEYFVRYRQKLGGAPLSVGPAEQ
jgi:CDP-diacylglycerol--glycerol-3-phosphate 3-phosphatidyltransferase